MVTAATRNGRGENGPSSTGPDWDPAGGPGDALCGSGAVSLRGDSLCSTAMGGSHSISHMSRMQIELLPWIYSKENKNKN